MSQAITAATARWLSSLHSSSSPDLTAWTLIPWLGVGPGLFEMPLADQAGGSRVLLAKVSRGTCIPEHFHSTRQALFLIAGRLRAGNGEWISGGFYRSIPAGQLHGPFVAEEDSILLSIDG